MPHCVRNGKEICWAWGHDDVVRANVGTGAPTPETIRDIIRECITDKNTFTWVSGGIQITACGKLVRTRTNLDPEVITCQECLDSKGR